MKANWTSTENSMCGSLGKNTNQALLPAGASVADVFDTWTRQMGYPFIRVNTEGKTLKVQQGKSPNQPSLYKQKQEKKCTLCCALYLLFSHGKKLNTTQRGRSA